jgi:hypothetical protein
VDNKIGFGMVRWHGSQQDIVEHFRSHMDLNHRFKSFDDFSWKCWRYGDTVYLLASWKKESYQTPIILQIRLLNGGIQWLECRIRDDSEIKASGETLAVEMHQFPGLAAENAFLCWRVSTAGRLELFWLQPSSDDSWDWTLIANLDIPAFLTIQQASRLKSWSHATGFFAICKDLGLMSLVIYIFITIWMISTCVN